MTPNVISHNTGDSGTFTSPHYPQDYPNNEECTWTIRGGPGKMIALSFRVFDLEEPGQICVDMVTVYAALTH